MKELLEEYNKNIRQKKRYLLKEILAYLFIIICIIVLGVYVGDILFGERSYEVLMKLQKEKAFLYEDIQKLKRENAGLQKEYLEKKALDPDLNK